MTDDRAPGEIARVDAGSLAAGWRWYVLAGLLVLLVYPATQWLLRRSGPTVAEAEVARLRLQDSFRHYQAGRHAEAVDAARAAIAADPGSADAYNNLAVASQALGNTDAAIQAATEALRLRPDFQLARNNLAWFQQEKAKGAGAAVPAERAAQASALLAQSLEAARAGRFQDCLDAATRAAEANPGLATAFSNRSYCLGRLERWDEGIRQVQEALRLDPGLQIARNNLAWLERERARAAQPGGR